MLYGVWLGQASGGRVKIIGVLSRLLDWCCLLFGGLVSLVIESTKPATSDSNWTNWMVWLTNSIGVPNEPHVQA
jgi:hypothetical protein